jgi:tetratricopeptide (TPR) repeat protein/transglutaminase-like putative cysteine protease
MVALILILAQGAFPTQSFVIERMHRTMRFESDGTGRTTMDVRVRIQSAAALQLFGQLTLPYGSAYQRLDVDTVRVHKVGGTTVTAPPSAVQDVDAPLTREAPIYSDLRLKIVTVPGLQPSDTLEYHLTWTTHTPLAPGQFWDNTDFLKKAVVLDERLVYDVPRATAVRVKTEGGADPRVTDGGDRRVYEWRRTNLVADTATERTSTLQRAKHDGARITTFRSWAEVGAWYGALAHERETVTPAIRQRAGELVTGQTTLLDSIAALYDYVSHRFRYVSLSFGVGRYQPHAAADVMANEYGDCKDKHVLLAALLSAIGVASAPVLISSDEPIDPEVPSPSQFDHVITFVLARGDTVWVDATPGVAPFRFLTWGLRNKQGLVMPVAGTATLSRTPLEPPFETFQRTEVVGSLSPLDRLHVKVVYTSRGDVEVFTRQVFQQLPEDRWPLFAQRVATHEKLKGTVSGASATDPTDTRGPFAFTFQVDQPGAVTWANRRAELSLPLSKIDVAEPDSTTPRDSIVVGVIREQVARLTLVVPSDVTLRLPIPVTVTRDYGTYRSIYERRGDTLVVERVLHFNARVLPAGRGRDLASFRHAIDDDQDQTVALQRSGDPRAPAVAGAEDVGDVMRAGSAALESGDAARALGLFREGLRRDPQTQWGWNGLGRAHLRLNQLDSAAAAFRKQIEINPYDQYAHNNLGLALWGLGRREDALAAFHKQVEVNPLDEYAHANLGRLLLELHRDSAAAQALEKAVAITPNDSALYGMLGTAYLHVNRAEDAVAAFERGLAISATPAAWHNIASALVTAGVQLDRAEGYARQAIDATAATLRDVHPDSISMEERIAVARLGNYWDTLGWIYFAKGDFRQAERYVRAAWLMNFQGPVGDHLGQIEMRLGRRNDAVHTYALALNAIRPPEGTRDRLQRLVGSQQVERVIDAARTEFVTMRTVRLKTPLFADVAGEVQLVFGAGARVESVRVVKGPASQLEPLRGAIRSATYLVALPDTTTVKIVRRGVVTCSTPSGTCVLVLFPADQLDRREMVVPVIRR